MEEAAQAAGIAKRTVIRLERNEHYAAGGPLSLNQLVAAYRARSIGLSRGGVVLLGGGRGSHVPGGPMRRRSAVRV
jgi:hypothetical protein